MLVSYAAEFDAEALDDCLMELPSLTNLLATSRAALHLAYAKISTCYDISEGMLDEAE